MIDQVEEFLQETQREENPLSSSEVLKQYTMLPLNSAAATATTPATRSPTPSPVRLTRKRRSPSPPSSFYEKLQSKRTPLFPPFTTTSAAAAGPIPSPSPPLERSSSEPIDFTENAEDSQILNSLATASTQLLKYSLSPEKSSLPPLPPSLRRTSSAPIPSDFYVVPPSTTPPRPPAPARATFSASPEKFSLPPIPPSLRCTSSARIPSDCHVAPLPTTPPRPPAPAKPTFSGSARSDQETPNSKRLRRMKEKMQEMTEWCYKVMHEADHDEAAEADHDETTAASEDDTTKGGDECEDEITEESVWVEDMNGGGLVVHFKCPCGNGYQILLDGKDCYYKLM